MGGIEGPIKTVVVLVLENRSFDHVLGWFNRLNPEIDGLKSSFSNPLNTAQPESGSVSVSDTAQVVISDPDHTFEAVAEQVFGNKDDTSADPPPMNGFAQQAETKEAGFSKHVMSAYDPDVLPCFKTLVTEFAICDRWFSSIPTLTQPNRMFIHSTTSHGAIAHVTKDFITGFPQKTVFESIHDAGLNFGIYFQQIPGTLFYRNLRKPKYLTKFFEYGFFKRHAKEGKLPNYVVIEPSYYNVLDSAANDDHPPHDIREGQKLVKDVYETLRASPQWNEILFLIIYDEHGGFFDHVPTPVKNVPNPDGLTSPDDQKFGFDRLGVRVPAFFISPWIERGTVLHEPKGPSAYSQFEHSSLPATVRKLFNLGAPLTRRDEWAGTFDSIINRDTPRTDCPENLPSVPDPEVTVHKTKVLTEFQLEMVQLASHLRGDNKDLETCKKMSMDEAKTFVEDASKEYIKSGCDALEKGQCEADVVWKLKVAPTLSKVAPSCCCLL